MNSSSSEKLEKRPQPDRYCTLCLGYGVLKTKDYKLASRSETGVTMQRATVDCSRCGGSGWMKADA